MPDKSVVGIVELAVNAEMPLPLTYPVKVIAPVPPLGTPNVPAKTIAPVVAVDGVNPLNVVLNEETLVDKVN